MFYQIYKHKINERGIHKFKADLDFERFVDIAPNTKLLKYYGLV